MTDESVRDAAEVAVEKILEQGQSISQGDMQVSRASLRDAHAIMRDEDDRTAQKSGRRPLFRNLNISTVG
jgi:hypothetical protein